MSINLIRKPTEAPSINASDDARMFKLACGGYNRGVVENYADECSYSVNGNVFTINNGEIVIDGYQTEIDGNGMSLTVDNISGNQYYVIYCETNLSVSGSEKSEIKYIYDTATYPTITDGDDLTQIKTGIARMVLYKFKASSGVISDVEKQFNIIKYGYVKNANNHAIVNGNEINLDYNNWSNDSDLHFNHKNKPNQNNENNIDRIIFENGDSDNTQLIKVAGALPEQPNDFVNKQYVDNIFKKLITQQYNVHYNDVIINLNENLSTGDILLFEIYFDHMEYRSTITLRDLNYKHTVNFNGASCPNISQITGQSPSATFYIFNITIEITNSNTITLKRSNAIGFNAVSNGSSITIEGHRVADWTLLNAYKISNLNL